MLNDLNTNGPLPVNAVLLTIDVSVLYTNIPHGEGLDTLRDILENRTDKTVPPYFIYCVFK